MAHGDRKTRKKRGTRSCGWGNTQKHRGSGSRGGVGMGGGKKQKWHHTSKFMPDHYGGTGFKRPDSMIYDDETINVADIEERIDGWVSKGTAKSDKKKYSLNLAEMGIDKLLGSGRITRAVEITVDKCTDRAKEKIEGAGGKVIVLEAAETEVKETKA
ncbi:MAG: hypothetical protein MSIBF_01530 [Candidatus Altiarchaeales archaeon IMC4]|nr:MAG: hypothetical protein MSIBF_01530 [Candidatus Altiarchaeales archaeon IMC4]